MDKVENIDFTLIDSLILDYAHIRRKTEMYKKRFPKYITGNDNYIGMIGEYWATRFIEECISTESLLDTYKEKESGEHSKSQPWYDFKLNHEDGQKEYISVKTIFEVKSGESGVIKHVDAKDFGENSILSIIILKLNDSLFPTELLYIKDLEHSLVNGEKDYKSKWDNKRSLIFKYYDSSKQIGFDKAFKKHAYIFNSDTETFDKRNK